MKYRWHLLAPAVVVAGIKFNSKSEMADPGFAALFLAMNFLIIASPYLIWLALSKERTPANVHSGFVGAHLALSYVSILIFRTHAPQSGNGWMLYFPIVLCTIPLFSKLGAWAFSKVGGSNA